MAAIYLNGEKIKEPLEAGKWYKTSLGKYDVVLDDNKNQGEDKPNNNKADNKADNSEEQDPSNEWNPDEEIQNPSDESLEDMEFTEAVPQEAIIDGYTKEEKESGEYTGVASGSFNYGATSEDLKARVENDVKAFKERYREATGEEFTGEIPADMLTASGSGLDPHISSESAEVQLPIVAAKSGLSEDEVEKIVENNTEHKVFGIFGEEKVNVLKCNLEIKEAMEG